MKQSIKAKKQPGQSKAGTAPGGTARRWIILAACLLATAGGTWAVLEFVVWSTLPSELVGTWVVKGGPQDGASFEFHRNGTLEAHLNNQDWTEVLRARVAVEDGFLYTTTRNRRTGKDETRRATIKELTARTLVVEFENREVWKMVRPD